MKRLPLSPMNGFFKTIFWVKLSPQRLYLLGDLNNEHEEFSPVSLRNSLSMTIFWVKVSYWVKLWSKETWTMNVQSFFCIVLIVFQIMPLLTWQKLLPHCKYEPHNNNSKWEYKPNIFACIYQNTTATITSYITSKYVPRQYALKCHMWTTSIYFISDNYVSTYTSNELTTIINVTISNGIHIFHIIGIYPWTHILTLDTYTCHISCISHWTNNVVYIHTPHYCTYKSNNKLKLLFTIL